MIISIAIFLCSLSTAAGAVEENIAEEANVEELNINRINETGSQPKYGNGKLEKHYQNNLTDSGGVFVDVSEAYKQLNDFRTQDSVWYWNSDDVTTTVFNTDDTNRLDPLIRDINLEESARIRAKEIVELFSHTRPDGTKCFTTYPDDLTAAGENIAYGQKTCFEVTEAWKEDSDPYSGQGHRRNMLSTKFNCVGIAGFKLNGVIYWVQAFGYDSTPTQATTPTQTRVAKLVPKLFAKNKSFKAKVKTKKYCVTLKHGDRKISNVKVTLKIKNKVHTAYTNGNGKATFKIKKSVKKGNHDGVVHFKGNEHFNPISKKVKIKIR